MVEESFVAIAMLLYACERDRVCDFQKVRVGKIVRLRTKVHDVPYPLKAARSLTDFSPALACSFLIPPYRKRLASSPFTWPQ